MATTLSVSEVNKLIEKLEKVGQEISKDKESALKFLIEAGIMDQDGNLTENYR